MPTPDDYLVLSKQFNYSVATYADLVANVGDKLYVNGDRIIVLNDENADDFWTVWAYRPLASDSNEHGLYFEAMQTYRTKDFWEVVDWYAPGYSPLNPPRIAYQTGTVRDLYEYPTPKHTFVRIEEDGTTGWSWTAYDGTGWTVVAREKATVKLSDAFYDALRPIVGDVYQTTADFADVARRDGSWELREIFNALRFDVLNNDEMNELFFSMLSFYHAQQDQVDWAFKTSFLSVLGYNERLQQTPIATYENTENLLEYLEEVKPYHVKIRDFSRVLTPDLDTAGVHATDFDKPLYYDAAISAYRRLDPNNPDDMALMGVTSPWSDWSAQHDKTLDYDPDHTPHNPIRNFAIKLRFDRYDGGELPVESGFGWDLAPLDLLAWDGEQTDIEYGSNALTRLLAYYHPTLGMIEASPDELLSGYSYRGIQTDGGDLFVPRASTLSEWGIRGFDTMPLESFLPVEQDTKIGNLLSVTPEILINPNDRGVGLRDPHHLPGHPEELVPVLTNSALGLTVETAWTKGAPKQAVTTIETRRTRKTTIDLSYEIVASSRDAILVYRDGVRAIEGEDYTVDYAKRVIRARVGSSNGGPKTKRITAHVFGLAGRDPIDDVVEYAGTGSRTTYAFDVAPTGTVEVYVDGEGVGFTRDGKTVTLAVPPADKACVMLVSYTRATVPSRVQSEVLAINSAQQWTLSHPYTTDCPVGHVGVILSRNGKTLNPPFTRIGGFVAGSRLVPFRDLPSVANVKIWLGGQPFTGTLGHLVEEGRPHTPDTAGQGWDRRGWDTDLYDVSGEIVVWRDHLWLNDVALLATYGLPSYEALPVRDDSASTNTILAVAYEDHDYVVQDNVLKMARTLAPSDYDVNPWDTAPYEEEQPVPADLRLLATTFNNLDTMAPSVHSFQGSPAGAYRVPVRVPSPDYLVVSVNGLTLTQGVDYAIAPESIGFDEGSHDHVGLGLGDTFAYMSVTIPGGQEPWEDVLVTAFEASPVRPRSTYGMIAAKPSSSIMGDNVLTPDWGFAPFDKYPLGSNVTLTKNFGTDAEPDMRDVKRMNDGWEIFRWERKNRVTLATQFEDDGVEIRVALTDADNPEVVTPNPFAVPDLDNAVPGAVYIAGERIEYYAMETAGDVVTLRELRRGTRATRIGQEQRRRTITSGDGTSTAFFFADANKDDAIRHHPIEVTLLGEDNLRSKQILTANYVLEPAPGGVNVVFKVPPPASVRVCMGQTFGSYHPKGTPVRSVSNPLHDDFGPFRVRDIPPEVDSDPAVRVYL